MIILHIHSGCDVFFILNLCFLNNYLQRLSNTGSSFFVSFIIADDFYLSNCCIVNLERKLYEIES